jgi:hypothetical protein
MDATWSPLEGFLFEREIYCLNVGVHTNILVLKEPSTYVVKKFMLLVAMA